ncbi:uncharacterized protein LOC142537142 [Primulina tabacum]|uniref:uncharacterized protein LOC142537142 n=1 Tax=Primulina tabacum TaxID=48773 RepID=UPI003F597D0C
MSSRRNSASSSRHDGNQQMQAAKESAAEAEITSSGRTSDSIPSVSSHSVSKVTKLDRLVESFSPLVPSRFFSEAISSGSEALEADSHPFFCLEDLWESLEEGSLYGAGVPLVLNGKDQIVQYYVPYLSGIQLYRDLSRPSSQLSSSSPQSPFFQYLEYERPYNRQPLTDKIFDLATQFPELNKCRSCDLLESSWLSIAWCIPFVEYPSAQELKPLFYRFIPYQHNRQQNNIDFSNAGKFPPYFSAANARAVYNPTDKKFSLPVFGMLSYKLWDSNLNLCEQHEIEQENSLVQAVDNWVGYLKVPLPNYHYFRPRHYSYRR